MIVINTPLILSPNLGSFENPFGFAVEEIVSPQRFLQHFGIDTKLLGIHFCKVAHSVTKGGEPDKTASLDYFLHCLKIMINARTQIPTHQGLR